MLRSLVLVPWVLVAAAACASHEPVPLDAEAILAAAAVRRVAAPGAPPVTLAEAAAALRVANPRVRDAWAEFRVAESVAAVPTPAGNPTVSAALLRFDGPEIVASARRGLEAAVGWALPLSGVRGAQDGVHAARREAAYAAAVRAEREEYLRLRRAFADLALGAARVAAARDVAAAARAAAESGRGLIAAGEATALDVQLLEIEAGRQDAGVIGEEEAVLDTQEALAAATGLPAARFDGAATSLPSEMPPLPAPEALRAALSRSHPGLALLRAEYVVAEESLRLEVARQFPSLDLGAGFERAGRENRFDLPFGIEIPLFDRNQQGIAEALAARDLVRVRFESEAVSRLAEIEAGRERLRLRQRRLDLLRGSVEPAAHATLELARRALPAGAIDALRFLDIVRAERTARLDVLAAQQDVLDAWTALEIACGAPLLVFPGEPGAASSPLPAGTPAPAPTGDRP